MTIKSVIRLIVCLFLCTFFGDDLPGQDYPPEPPNIDSVTNTESLIRTLGDFKAEKLIEIKEGKIIIPDPVRLKNMPY